MKTIIALLSFLVFAPLPLNAQSGVPETSTFVHDFYAAYSKKDVDKMAQFYGVDATFADPSFELNLKGRDQISDLLKKALAKYETLDFEIAHTISAGDELVVEGKMTGKLPKNTVRVPFVSIFRFKEGKISSQRDMFDVLHFFTQLGARMINREE